MLTSASPSDDDAIVSRALRSSMPSRSRTSSFLLARRAPCRPCCFAESALRLRELVVGFLHERELVLVQTEALPRVAIEEHRVGVLLRLPRLRDRLQPVAIAEPHHRLAAEDPLAARVVEAALGEVDDLARAVGANEADFSRRDARHVEVEQDPLAVRAPLEVVVAAEQLLVGENRARLLGREVRELRALLRSSRYASSLPSGE